MIIIGGSSVSFVELRFDPTICGVREWFHSPKVVSTWLITSWRVKSIELGAGAEGGQEGEGG